MPDDRGCYWLSVRRVEHERDRPAVGKIDLFLPISRSQQHRVLFERYLMEVRSEQTKVRWRQRSQESICNAGMTLHHGRLFPSVMCHFGEYQSRMTAVSRRIDPSFPFRVKLRLACPNSPCPP